MKKRRRRDTECIQSFAGRLFIGIDPGASGAIAAVDVEGRIREIHDWPGNEIAAVMVFEKLYSKRVIGAAIEANHGRGGMSSSSMFNFGKNEGIWRGILAAYQVPFIEVKPAQWQKGFFKKADGKKAALNVCCRLYPSQNKLFFGPKGGKKDGRCDALLIARYALNHFKGG
jgi:hypothetical protein